MEKADVVRRDEQPQYYQPAVDVRETPEELVLQFDMPDPGQSQEDPDQNGVKDVIRGGTKNSLRPSPPVCSTIHRTYSLTNRLIFFPDYANHPNCTSAASHDARGSPAVTAAGSG